MTADVNISITGKDDGIQVFFRVATPDAPKFGTPLSRPPLQLSDEWQPLFSGVVPATQLDPVVAKLSGWLLGDELGELLAEFLDKAPEPVRLVFSVDDRSLAELADLPFELVQSPGDSRPLGLDRHVGSVIYAPPGETPPQTIQKRDDLPIRVLMVRSNPKVLGPHVPSASSIRAELLEEEDIDAEGLLEVDILSREEGSIGLPLFGILQEQAKRRAYDIIVYLGHGMVDEDSGAGLLALETANDDDFEPVDAERLTDALGPSPAPVVLLVGCTTAVSDLAREGVTEDEIADRMRGSRNLAKELVKRKSGVEVAVGMRYEMEAPAAALFLRTFFRSFIREEPGHVESALQAGRRALRNKWPSLLTWSAPLAYRVRGTEPMFQGLAETVAEQRPEGQATMKVIVRGETEVTARTWEAYYPPGKAVGQVGDHLLRETVSVLEEWLRAGDFHEGRQFEVLGGLLYRLLFNGPVADLFDEVYNRLGEQRLLVRLSFGDRATNLRTLPWEYLYAPASDRRPGEFFFAGYGSVSLVLSRFSSTAERRWGDQRRSENGQLRILVVIPPAAELSTTHADDADEMRKAFERLKEVSIEPFFLPNPDVSNPGVYDLSKAIEDEEPHVVHFVGHGRIEGKEQQILLSDWVNGGDFVASLVASRDWKPRVVFLQLTDWSPKNVDADFAQLGPELIERGVRAVVAMRYPITNTAAKAFCEVFYPALAEGEMIDVGVQVGMREMIGRAAHRTGDRLFGTPVFYIQSAERIIQREPSGDQGRPDSREPPDDGGGTPDELTPQPDPGFPQSSPLPSDVGVTAEIRTARLESIFAPVDDSLARMTLAENERAVLASEFSRIRRALEEEMDLLKWRGILEGEVLRARDDSLRQIVTAILVHAPTP